MPPRVGKQIELGDKVVTLRYTGLSLSKLEELRREPLYQTVLACSQASIKAIAAFIWAGRLWEDPKLKLESVIPLLEPPLTQYVEAIMDAMRPWLPNEKKAGEGDEEEGEGEGNSQEGEFADPSPESMVGLTA